MMQRYGLLACVAVLLVIAPGGFRVVAAEPTPPASSTNEVRATPTAVHSQADAAPETRTEAVMESLNRLGRQALGYAVLLAAVGTMSMALLEFVKAIGGVRLRFHRYYIARWFGADKAAYREMLVLAAGEMEGEAPLMDQPSEKMLGQIQAAANLALEFPNIYGALYRFLTRPPGISVAPDAQQASSAPLDDGQRWEAFAVKAAKDPGSIAGEGAGAEETRAATQARARLGHLVARRLDALQSSLEYRWARLNQIASVVLGASIFRYAIANTPAVEQTSRASLFGIAVVAGLVAPFAKDLVSGLSAFGTKR